METLEQVMKEISDMQRNCKGLDIEILATAFLYLKENPDKSVGNAIVYGFHEWIK